MPPKWSLFPKGSLANPANDTRHNRVDSTNRSGGPLGRQPGMSASRAPGQGSNPGGQAGVSRTGSTPMAKRGGFGQQGRDKVYVRAGMSGGRSGSGNPASRGGFSGEARGGNFRPESRVGSHGGSPQVRERHGAAFPMRGGFGSSGQGRDNRHAPGALPSYGATNPAPGAGNVSGTAAKRVMGRFKRGAMGATATSSSSGKYGSPPVTANT